MNAIAEIRPPLGFVEMTNNEYHAAPGLSSSGVKLVNKSPLHYFDKYLADDREPNKATPAMLLGSMVHTLVLEPHLFGAEFISLPADLDLRTKAGKAEKAARMAAAGDAELVSFDAVDKAKAIAGEVLRNTDAVRALGENFEASERRVENSFFWRDAETDVLLKMRPDIFLPRITSDLKTCADASEAGFAKQIANFGYSVSAAMYLDGNEQAGFEPHRRFLFIAVETTRPYPVKVWLLSDDDLELGWLEYRAGVRRYAECMANDEWPGYPAGIQTISRPGWALKMAEQAYC